MNLSKIPITKTALPRLMVTLGIIVNLALVTGGAILARVGPSQASLSMAPSLTDLEEEVESRQALLSQTQQQKIGRRDVEAFTTFLELRGLHDEVLAVIAEIQKAFKGTLVTENVDATGPANAWLIRLSLKQIIEG